MAEKKYKGRRAYLNDFHKDEKGNYEYQGDLYVWDGNPEELKKEKLLLWLVSSGMVATLVSAGCIDAPGAMNCFYVVIPYMISFVMGVSAAWGLWRLTEGGTPLRAYIYQASIEQIPFRAIVIMLSAGATVLGEIIYLFINGFSGKAMQCLGFLLLEVFALALAFVLKKRVENMCWRKKA